MKLKLRSLLIKGGIAILVLLLGAGGFYGYNVYKALSKMEQQGKNEVVDLDKIQGKNAPINFLILGVDAGEFMDGQVRNERGRSDTLMLASYHPKDNKIYVLSIPRDSRVKVKGSLDKINHAYAYGGTNLSVKTVEEFLNVPIHHYIRLNYLAFIEIVDTLGGVTLDVDPKINKEFNIGKNPLPTGKGVRLDGNQAFTFVHVRNSDIERTGRQQQFLKALFAEARSVDIIWKLPSLLNTLGNNMQTDMDPGTLLSLAKKVRSVPAENVESITVPGKAQRLKSSQGQLLSYWVVDEQNLEVFLQKVRGEEKTASTTSQR